MTLIELIISVSLICVMFSIIGFSMNINKYKTESFIRQFVSDIRYTRIKNISGDNDTYIKYEKIDNQDAYVLCDKSIKKTVKLPKGVVLNKKISQIKFHLGTGALNDKGETIKIVDSNKKVENIITIVPFSGRVLYKEDIYNEK